VTILPDLTDQYPQAAANMAPNRPSRAASAEELQRLSAVYMLSPGGVEVKKNFHLSMAQPTGADTHTGIFRMTNSGWEFLGRNLVDGRLSAATDGFGQFAIFRDLKAPVVELPKDDGTEYEKEYVFSLKDKGAGIDVVATKLFLDGDPVTTRYDESKEEMTVILPSRLVQGLHELSGDVVDKLGNSAPLQQAPLRAAGFMDVLNVMPWPNPAVITSRIRYTLGKTVTSLSLRIYDGSGRTVHKMNNFGPADMTAGNHDSPIWMLTNDSMRAVANGTYFFRVIAKDAEGKQVVRTGKIAVLR
jgi:hypothetical protein